MKKFTRKWNAFRHVRDIHNGFATFSNHGRLVFMDKDFYDKGIFPNDHLSEYDKEDEIDEHILEIYGKIIKPFEELEKLYSNYPEPDRTKYLGHFLSMALLSTDPIKEINNTINFRRKLNGRTKIMHYVSKNYGMNLVQVDSYLTKLIKSRPYFSDV